MAFSSKTVPFSRLQGSMQDGDEVYDDEDKLWFWREKRLSRTAVAAIALSVVSVVISVVLAIVVVVSLLPALTNVSVDGVTVGIDVERANVGIITGNDIATEAIEARHIAPLAVTSGKLEVTPRFVNPIFLGYPVPAAGAYFEVRFIADPYKDVALLASGVSFIGYSGSPITNGYFDNLYYNTAYLGGTDAREGSSDAAPFDVDAFLTRLDAHPLPLRVVNGHVRVLADELAAVLPEAVVVGDGTINGVAVTDYKYIDTSTVAAASAGGLGRVHQRLDAVERALAEGMARLHALQRQLQDGRLPDA